MRMRLPVCHCSPRGSMRMAIVLLLTLCFIHPCFGLYSKTSSVQSLEAQEFKSKVKDSDEVWLIQFFASWCGHSKRFVPEYEKTATALRGVVKVGAVEDSAVSGQEGVGGFPTVKLYLGKGNPVVDFKQQRDSGSLIDFVTRELNALAKRRINKKPNGSNEGSKKSKKGPSDVVELTDSNFMDLVTKDEKSVWFVKFYAPWCGHCQALASTWDETGRALKNKVKVGKVDATTNPITAAQFTVKEYPTLMLFPGGPKSTSKPVIYDQQRDLDAMVSFALGFASEMVKAVQLLNDQQFQEDCTKGVCVIAFLPHLLDSGGAEGRNKYLQHLNAVVKSSATMPVKFYWVEGGKNFDLEEALRLQFGWPAIIATRIDKSKYAIHKGDFSTESIRQFIVGLMAGRTPLNGMPERLPPFKTMKEWDGKDVKETKPAAAAPDDEL